MESKIFNQGQTEPITEMNMEELKQYLNNLDGHTLVTVTLENGELEDRDNG